MGNLFKKSILFAAALLAVATISSSAVYASDEDVVMIDSSNNVFAAGQMVDFNSLNAQNVGNEAFAAGLNVNIDDVVVDGSVFTAGNTLSIKDSNVGSSVFAAGQNIYLNSTVRNNIWAAGSYISAGGKTNAKALHAAGGIINVEGTYQSVSVSGGNVTFNAVVDGDVKIEGETITFGENALVNGNLTVVSAKEPTGVAAICTGDYSFEESAAEDDADDDDNSSIAKDVSRGSKKAVTAGVILAKILKMVKSIILNIFKFAILGAIFAIVFKKNMADAYVYSKEKAGAFWGFGALLLFAFPIAAIILCVTVIGLPLAGLLSTIYVLALSFARVFAFGSLVRELIFTHTSKRFSPVIEVILVALIAGVTKPLPIIGGLLGLACSIYTMGYIVLAVKDTISGNVKEIKAETPEKAPKAPKAEAEKTEA